MKNILLIIILSFFCNQLYSKELITVSGTPVQGEILYGSADESIERIFLNSDEIYLNNKEFLMGFDRDAKLNNILTIIEKSGNYHKIPFNISERTYKIDRIEKINSKYLVASADKDWIDRVNNEAKILKRSWDNIYNTKKAYYSAFARPVERGRISSQFGSQRYINGIPKQPHNGVDIAVPLGTEVKAISDGLIQIIGDFFYLGKCVMINHGAGLGSIYAHLDSITVVEGQYVTTQTKIGYVGSTGRSTGPHLHLGMMMKEKRIDPLSFLKNKNIFLTIVKESENQ